MAKVGQVATIAGRKEPGFWVPISTRQVTVPGADATTEVNIDLSNAEVPDKTYFGDVCGVEELYGTFRIMFGQTRRDGRLRSMVTLSMSVGAAIQFAELANRLTGPNLGEVLQSVRITPEALTEFKDDPEDAVVMKASLAAIGIAGSEACIDFYEMSPYAMAHVQHGGSKMTIRGVVRVDTRTALLYSLVERLMSLKGDRTALMGA